MAPSPERLAEPAVDPLAEARAALFEGVEATPGYDVRRVPIRDATKRKALEVVFDENGDPVLEDEKDKDGDTVIDEATGDPKQKAKTVWRHPPKVFPDGKTRYLEVRRPTIDERAAIMKAARAHKGSDKMEFAQLQTEGIIRLTYLPGTQKRVFTPADRPSMLNQRTNGWVDEIAEVVISFINVDEKDLAKNSARTPSGKPSSR